MKNERYIIMNKLFYVSFFLLSTFLSIGQTVDENPNVPWTYVRSSEIVLQPGVPQNFEIPLDKNAEYQIIIDQKYIPIVGAIKLYDLQEKIVKQGKINVSNNAFKLQFTVDDGGTYNLVITLAHFQKSKTEPIKVSLNLIRRGA